MTCKTLLQFLETAFITTAVKLTSKRSTADDLDALNELKIYIYSAQDAQIFNCSHD